MTATEIKKVALSLFAEKGYEETTLGEIAREVGIKTPSIYAHFASKEEIFWCLVEEQTALYVQHLEASFAHVEGADIETQLYSLLREMTSFVVQNSETASLYKRIWMHPPLQFKDRIRRVVTEVDRMICSRLAAILAQGVEQNIIRDQNLEELTQTYLCLVDGYTFGLMFYDDDSYTQKLDGIWRVFWQGLKR
ncbi:TetR/AcrR family transcriptional regulator [Tumebacillus flagellatus]|uniref:HTH tetR-type domain-containing protein n=1 Tax=Tumebacillus flagellatus TaxID=1157490 RepID=A0A074MG04_9BACL|nr:TetR/AcrR family transcriptional regulator [Tumebacillus flagellatus]KEO84627.1 hypothetical protein EL26_03680 [Tumebacillus flagellatus]